MNKYKSLVKRGQEPIFLIGADTEDIIQEGMIGLYKAMRDFQKIKMLLLGHLQNFVSIDK